MFKRKILGVGLKIGPSMGLELPKEIEILAEKIHNIYFYNTNAYI